MSPRLKTVLVIGATGSVGRRVVIEAVDYGGVLNVLAALDGRNVRNALMTAIGVTNREGHYNRTTEARDWKRRGIGTQPGFADPPEPGADFSQGVPTVM